jgi:aryl-alcohol dehydrogenase-like predicted oxidoreductase
MLFGTWEKDKTFPAGDARGDHKDYLGARFQRNLAAVDEIKAVAESSGLTCAQLCVGVLLATPGLTGCIVGARDAAQGARVADLAVSVTPEQVELVQQITSRLRDDLAQL